MAEEAEDVAEGVWGFRTGEDERKGMCIYFVVFSTSRTAATFVLRAVLSMPCVGHRLEEDGQSQSSSRVVTCLPDLRRVARVAPLLLHIHYIASPPTARGRYG